MAFPTAIVLSLALVVSCDALFITEAEAPPPMAVAGSLKDIAHDAVHDVKDAVRDLPLHARKKFTSYATRHAQVGADGKRIFFESPREEAPVKLVQGSSPMPLGTQTDPHTDRSSRDAHISVVVVPDQEDVVRVQKAPQAKPVVASMKPREASKQIKVVNQEKLESQYKPTFQFLKEKQEKGGLDSLTPLQQAILSHDALSNKKGESSHYNARLLALSDAIKPHVWGILAGAAVVVCLLILVVASKTSGGSKAGFAFIADGESTDSFESSETGSTERVLQDRMDRFAARLDHHKQMLENGSSPSGSGSEITDSQATSRGTPWV